MRSFQLTVISLLLLQLSSCGFHLRGYNQQHGAYQPIEVQQTHGDNGLRRLITQQLSMRGIKNPEENDDSTTRRLILSVSDIERGDTVLSLDANIRTAERLLTLSAKLNLWQHDGEALESAKLQEQRILFTNPDNPVGNSTEQTLLLSEMESAIARRIAEQATRWLDREQANAASTRPTR